VREREEEKEKEGRRKEEGYPIDRDRGIISLIVLQRTKMTRRIDGVYDDDGW